MPDYMLAQVPFNTTETTALNAGDIDTWDSDANLKIILRTLHELGEYRHVHEAIRFLELGCGNGYFLYELSRTGHGEYYGLEPLEQEYTRAVDTMKKAGIDAHRITHTLIESAQYHDNYFDIIFSYHVIEHLENPLAMITQARRWLKQNGTLIIICPNAEGAIPQQTLATWRLNKPAHRWLPGKKSLSALLKKNNFHIQKCLTYGGYSAPRGLFKNIANQWFKITGRGDVLCLSALCKKEH